MKNLKTATEAINQLRPDVWSKTSIEDRTRVLEQIQQNIKTYADNLAKSDKKMKNKQANEKIYSDSIAKVATIVPLTNTLTACIDLYKALEKDGEPLKPISINKVKDNLYDIHVFPKEIKDKIMYGKRKDYIRVKGEPKQVSPMEKPTEIIAVLGAGNYSSSSEMVKALFLENCAVVHKPHQLNEETDQIWAKIFKPLVDIGALSFCLADQGQELTKDKRLSKIYFTGSSETAKAIMNSTDTKLVSEYGGNNPCIIVPGVRAWTKKEIKHQAVQIATMAKLNGGAVCGRPQTIVTCKNWAQREEFLLALKDALEIYTPAAGTYYPGSEKVIQGFKKNCPEAKILKPQNGKYKSGEFILITDAPENDYCVTHEAFCQILSEVPLDTTTNVKVFLEKAVDFCNTKLLGTLGSCIIIDEDTKKAHKADLANAISEMNYGGIAINAMPPFIFLNPYLTWGGHDSDKDLVSGHGHFGNLLCYENIEKSIIYDSFMSPGHMLNTNISAMDELSENMSAYSIEPTWGNLFKLMWGAIKSNFKGKDF